MQDCFGSPHTINMELQEANIICIWKAASKVEQFLKFDELHNFGYAHHNQSTSNCEDK
jgi:hypothetical protein